MDCDPRTLRAQIIRNVQCGVRGHPSPATEAPKLSVSATRGHDWLRTWHGPAQCTMRKPGTCSKLIKNFKMAIAEPEKEPGALSAWGLWTAWLAYIPLLFLVNVRLLRHDLDSWETLSLV